MERSMLWMGGRIGFSRAVRRHLDPEPAQRFAVRDQE